MSKIRGEFIGFVGLGYVLSAIPKDYTFYTILGALDSFLVSIDAIKAGLSFPLKPFVMDYL